MRFREFPTIEFLWILQRLGFSDRSWHNDSAARAELTLPSGSILVAWVAQKDPDQREFVSGPRFGIQIRVGHLLGVAVILVANFEDEKEFSDTLEKLVSCFNDR